MPTGVGTFFTVRCPAGHPVRSARFASVNGVPHLVFLCESCDAIFEFSWPAALSSTRVFDDPSRPAPPCPGCGPGGLKPTQTVAVDLHSRHPKTPRKVGA